MFKFLHTADIHLDSPLLNLARNEALTGSQRQEFMDATRQAFDNIVYLAIQERVQFVLIAGDLYDGESGDFSTPLHVRRQMQRLQEHDIRVFIIYGNHDAESVLTTSRRLTMPDNVHIFKSSKPESVALAELNVVIHGQSFKDKAVREDLSANYPKAKAGSLNIGMLHTNCGTVADHDPYAPSTVSGLQDLGYDYWALGHIHKPQELTSGDPWIVYSGNPQGRHINEDGPRGCVIATVDDQQITLQRHEVDVVRWQRLQVDVTGCSQPTEAIELAADQVQDALTSADGRSLAVRVELSGPTAAHAALLRSRSDWEEQLREQILDRADDQVWLEKFRLRTRPERSVSGEVQSELDELETQLASDALATAAWEAVQDDFAKLYTKLPQDHRQTGPEPAPDSQTPPADLMREAREFLIAHLREQGGNR